MNTLILSHINRIYDQLKNYLSSEDMNSLLIGSPEWEKEIDYDSDGNITKFLNKKGSIYIRQDFQYNDMDLIDQIVSYVSDDHQYDYKFVGMEFHNYDGDGNLINTQWHTDLYHEIVKTPAIQSPINGSLSVSIVPVVKGSKPSPLFLSDMRIYREFEIDTNDTATSDFSIPVMSKRLNSNEWELDDSLEINADYKVRIRDVYESGSTEWSDVIVFQTGSDYVETPTISVEGAPDAINPHPVLTGDAYSVSTVDTSDYHESTDWRVLRTYDASVIWESLENASDLESITLPDGTLSPDTEYRFMVRYKSGIYGYSEWEYVTHVTSNSFVENPTLTVEGAVNNVVESPDLSGSAFTVVSGSDTHDSTDWKVLKTSDSSNVWESLGDTSNLESIKVPAGVLNPDTEYKFMTRYKGQNYGWSEWSEVVATTESSFMETGPGPDTASLTYDGTTKTGYYGHTTAAELISGSSLASQIGLSAGTAFNDTAGWEKFFVGADADCNSDSADKVLFIAKKTLRYDLSWDSIDAVNAVYGTTITIGSNQYKVRLLRGAGNDPAPHYGTSCSDNPGENSEWNDLLYRIHQDSPTCSSPSVGMPGGNETNRHGGPQVGSNWNNYSDSDLQVYYNVGDGSYSCCQETDASDSGRRVRRGNGGVAGFNTGTASYSYASYGWRPCLELV